MPDDRPRGLLRRVLAITGKSGVALLAAVVVAGTAYAWTVTRTLSSLTTSNVLASRSATATPSPTPAAPRQAFNALIVGLDSRTDAQGNPLPPALLAQLHAGDATGELNTDTIMLVHVPAAADQPVVTVSFPRDSYVDIADGSGRHKINSAYGRGYYAQQAVLQEQGVSGAALDQRSREAGRATLISTVEGLTGVRIDHYAEVNMGGFVELTNTLGGVPVCLVQPVDDSYYSGLVLPAGPQTVSGANALAFVRQRHGLPGGDLDRITRQQAFLAGVTHQVLSAGTLADPRTVSKLLDVVARYVVVDSGWDLTTMVGQLGQLVGSNVVFRTIPTVRPDLVTPEDGTAVEIDDAAVRQFVSTILTTDPRIADTAPAPTTDPTPAGSVQDTTRIRASGPTPTTTPVTPAPTSAAAPSTQVVATADPNNPWQNRPVIDAAGVPCVN